MEGSFCSENSTTDVMTSKSPIKKEKKIRQKKMVRPYKKLSDEMLKSRICELHKKINFLSEKLDELKERCTRHETEQSLRVND